MPACKKCHRSVISATLICHDCETENGKTALSLRTAICTTCSLHREKEACSTCEAMLLLDKLMGDTTNKKEGLSIGE